MSVVSDGENVVDTDNVTYAYIKKQKKRYLKTT